MISRILCLRHPVSVVVAGANFFLRFMHPEPWGRDISPGQKDTVKETAFVPDVRLRVPAFWAGPLQISGFVGAFGDFLAGQVLPRVGKHASPRVPVHMCARSFETARIPRLHPPRQRRKGGDPPPLPSLPFRRASLNGQWVPHCRTRGPLARTVEAPSAALPTRPPWPPSKPL